MKMGRKDGQKEKGGNKRKRKQSTKGKVVKKERRKVWGEGGEEERRGAKRSNSPCLENHRPWRGYTLLLHCKEKCKLTKRTLFR